MQAIGLCPYPMVWEDIQQQHLKTVRCVYCHTDVPKYETSQVGEDIVCSDCLCDYCADKVGELGPEYIEENEQKYLANCAPADDNAMYYNFWLDSLDKPDRLRIIKAAYHREKENKMATYSLEMESDFCKQEDDWEAFVMKNCSNITR